MMLWRHLAPVEDTRPCAVYALYNAAGKVIYVGISCDPEERWRQHQCDKPWAGEAVGWHVDWYDTRAAAKARETFLIRTLRTRWNLDESPVEAQVRARYIAMFGCVPGSPDRRRLPAWPWRLVVGVLRFVAVLTWMLVTGVFEGARKLAVFGLSCVFGRRRRSRRRSMAWLAVAGLLLVVWSRAGGVG